MTLEEAAKNYSEEERLSVYFDCGKSFARYIKRAGRIYVAMIGTYFSDFDIFPYEMVYENGKWQKRESNKILPVD